MVNIARVFAALVIFSLAACAHGPELPSTRAGADSAPPDYRIGPGDSIQVFVWHNPDLSLTVPVRPDGKISIPLVQDISAIGKTPMELSSEIEGKLKKFVNDPQVTIIVQSFVGPFSQQVRVIGEAAKPQAIPYRANMTLLDAMIQVGGLTQFAAGNRAVIIRKVNGQDHTYPVHLDSLINDGNVEDNAPLQPGDILIIPQTYF